MAYRDWVPIRLQHQRPYTEAVMSEHNSTRIISESQRLRILRRGILSVFQENSGEFDYESLQALWNCHKQTPPKINKSEINYTLRFQIFKRDRYRCQICGVSAQDADDIQLEIDHKHPRVKGGTNDPGNLWVLCFPCNRGKGTRLL